jgi:DNA modification methylase
MNFYHLDDIPDDLRAYFQPAPQIGLEKTPEEYVAKMVAVFREVRRVLRKDGTLWLNLGDSYAGSGKGGNPIDSPHKKQRTNSGSLSVIGNTARDAAKTKHAGEDILCGFKPKDLVGIPWMVAFALRADGWYLRQDIIWSKPNPMPESVTDRCTKAHEYIFLMSKSARYYYDSDAVKEPYAASSVERYNYSAISKTGKTSTEEYKISGSESINGNGVGRSTAGLKSHEHKMKPDGRNKRSVWTVSTNSYSEAHFATFPPDLIKPCVLAGCPAGGTVLDPFGGSGTTGMVALELGRSAILIELNEEYVKLIEQRTDITPGLHLT